MKLQRRTSRHVGRTTLWSERVYSEAKRALTQATSSRGRRGNLKLGISKVGKKQGFLHPAYPEFVDWSNY
jgi:hypothetical protein